MRSLARTVARQGHTILLGLLVGCFFLNALYSTLQYAPTQDEGLHYVAGLSYWQLNDYRLQPENGNLPQRLAALPAYLLGYRLPEGYEQYFEIGDQASLATYGIFKDPARHYFGWALGRIFLLAINTGALLLAYRWSRDLWGRQGALLTTALLAACPTFLGHAGLTTSDGLFVLLGGATLYAFHRSLDCPNPRNTLLCGLLSGLACVTKYTVAGLVVVMAIYGLWILGRDCWNSRLHRETQLGRRLLACTTIVLLAYTVLWAHYGFRYSMYAPSAAATGQTLVSYGQLESLNIPTIERITWLRAHRLLPESYLHGLAFTKAFSMRRQSYFLGELRFGGWYSYFPLAFLIKSPLPSILCSLLALTLGVRALLSRRWPTGNPSLLGLTVLAGLVVGGMAVLTQLNIGFRHILPCLLLLYVLSGMLLAEHQGPRRRRWLGGICCALLGLLAVETARNHGRYLSYFNQLIGTRTNAYHYLADSNLDWGQDMEAYSAWLLDHQATHPKVPHYHALFTPVDLETYGVHGNRIYVFGGANSPSTSQLPELRPGYYAVSRTLLTGLYCIVYRPWLKSQEDHLARMEILGPERYLAELPPERDFELRYKLKMEHLNFRWEYLRRQCLKTQPYTTIGDGIVVYYLGAEQLRFFEELRMLSPQS